ncbi:CU044_5270 family protein [Nonomuraea sp. NPDC046570]|uniref:CU044_5270 family protein n=1 Tax=Nonomuraea sp. NPDC046570 TaxID=3155255 RepID=UPI0033F46530
MDDEIEVFAKGRPAASPYPEEARRVARERLLGRAAAGGRGWRLPRMGWQAAGAFGLTVVLVGGVAVALSGRGEVPALRPLDVTASVVARGVPELDPKPGQFIVVESETMHPSYSFGSKETRHLYRTKRKIWQSVDGKANGLLMVEGLEPRQYPGWPIPDDAKDWEGRTSWMEELPACPDLRGDRRTDYVHVGTLPTEARAMLAHLYEMNEEKKGKTRGNPIDERVFESVMALSMETYLPRAQRKALFEAAKEIPGVEVAEGVEDSAGRKGVALGRIQRGVLAQLIFDERTYGFMGQRDTVVDAAQAQAPKGSLLALTAQTSVSVVDTLPQVDGVESGSCMPQPTITATITPTPIPEPGVTVTITPIPDETG